MKKEAVTFGEKNNLIGIITEPDTNFQKKSNLGVIFLNSGFIHRVGQNRSYVHLAIQLAEKGYTSLRFDSSGLGDSLVKTNYLDFEENAIYETQVAMDFLQDKKGIANFIIIGLCSGAEVAFKTAQKNDKIIGIIGINGKYIEEEKSEFFDSKANNLIRIRYYKKNMFSRARWIKIFSGKSQFLRISNLKLIFNLISIKPQNRNTEISKTDIFSNDIIQENNADSLLTKWKNLFDRNIKCFLAFAEGSSSLDVFELSVAKKLKEMAPKKLLDIEIIRNADHSFTTIYSQDYLNNKILSWIDNYAKKEVSKAF